MEALFLGSGDDHGVPRLGCDCDICRNARSPNSRNHRTSASLALRYGPSYARRCILVDATPEIRIQATRIGLGPFDALLLTHAHDAHILGLGVLLQAQRQAERPLRVCAPDQVLDEVRARLGTLWDDKAYRRILETISIDQTMDLWDLEVCPLRADHGLGGMSYGYLLTLGDWRLAYLSDMIQANREIREALTDLDLLVLGTSHYYESIDIWKRSVMDIVAAQDLIQDVAPRQAVLTHLSHTIDYDDIQSKLDPAIHLAYDGLTVEVTLP